MLLTFEFSRFLFHALAPDRKQERIVKAVDVSKTLLHYGW